MTGILNTLIAGVSGAVKDAYFNLVSLLLPGNGTNGANNNFFLDSSSNNFTITRNPTSGPNAPTQGTFSPFSQTGWGNYFNNSGTQYLTVPSNAAFSLSATSWTIEFFVFPLENAPARERMWINRRETSGAYNASWQIYSGSSSNAIKFFVGSSVVATSTSGLTANQWNHVAVVWNGTTLRFFINGTQDATTASSGAGSAADTQPVYIGQSYSGDYIYSYISNLRIVKGVAVYTGSFTVPITPLAATQSAGTNISAITGTQTSLLTCQSNRFIDNSVANSGAGFTITANGGASVTPFSPFAPTQFYSAAAVGGSGYFDGTGDYLTVPDNAAFDFPGDFTIETWIYLNGTGQQHIYEGRVGSVTNALLFYLSASTQPALYINGSVVMTGSLALTTGQWHHLVATRLSNTLYLFVNGSSVATPVSNSTSIVSPGSIYIGSNDATSGGFINGYLSGYRVLKGTGYSSVTVPTAPPTAITNTSLLLNFTNAGVVDATAKNVLETVGNAQISTTQSKWGGGSIYLDGTSNTYVRGPVQIYLGSSNFTIEGWVRFNSIPGAEFDIYKIQDKNDGSSFGALRLILNSSMKLKFLASTTGSSWGISVDNLGNTLSTGVWYYIAITRSGSDFKVYVNGSQAGATQTLSGALYAGPINALGWNGVTTYSNMYFDDVRLTIGLVRDVTTSPIAPFPVQ